ncbi:DUF305 domain-containing protein [Amycolatopsis sp. NPDC004625]|uniref:DUF305 domain-containing protein n=1 Tax=Amycolatopsis sp. NPDC004625 TaxID=3154670 RepID=UPI0033B6723B
MRRPLLGAAVVALIMGGCATTGPAAPAGPSPFNPTDVAWLQLVVPMTEHALDAARLAPGHTQSPTVGAVAGTFASAQENLLGRLRAARDRAGLPATDIHSGHKMPGMVTPADLVALRTERGAGFDRRLIGLLRAHAAQLVVLAQGEQTSGEDAETRALARETGAEGTHQAGLLAKTT